MVKRNNLHTFGGFYAFVDKAKRNAREDEASHQTKWPGYVPKNWAGASWDEAVRLAEKGWPEGYKAVKKQSEALYLRIVNKIPVKETVFTDAPIAGVMDMGKVVNGEPECWIEEQTTEEVVDGPSNKAVHIVFNCSAAWTVARSVLFTRGAAAVALAEALEFAGRSVKITVVQSVSGGWGDNGKDPLEMRVLVKDYDGRANYDLLAFALCHAAMLRRFVFGYEEGLDDNTRRKFGIGTGGYGSPVNTTDQGDIYLPAATGYESQWTSADAAEAWIVSQLREQGVYVEE